MALRSTQDGSAQNGAEKLNKQRSRRTSDQKAGLFDLRGENRNPAFPDVEYTDTETTERPYRERHRVEVQGRETLKGSDSGSYSRSAQESGRIMRGNVPASRRLRDDMLTDGSRPGAGGYDSGRPASGRPESGRPESGRYDSGRSDSGRYESGRPGAGRSEIEADLFPVYSGRAGTSSRVTRGRTGTDGVRTDGNVRASRPSGTSRTYADFPDEGIRRSTGTYAGTQSGRAAVRGTASKASPSTLQRPRKAWDPDEYLRQSGDIDVDAYDPEYGRKTASGSGGSAAGREDPGARTRRRKASRKERERQLRRQYLRLGIGASLALLIIIFGVVAAVRIFRGDHSSDEGTASRPAQETAAANQDSMPESEEGGQKETKTDQPEDAAQETADHPDPEEKPAEGQEDQPGSEGGRQENPEKDRPEQTEDSRQEESAGPDDTQTDDGGQESPLEETDIHTGLESIPAGPGQPEPAESIPAGQGQSAPAEDGLHTQSFVRQDEWNMILVNRWNPLPEGHTVETTSLMNGESVDSRCYSALQEMLNDCAASGGTPIVCSSYRPHEKQVRLYEAQVDRMMGTGLDRKEAEAEAATEVAVPGTSEHELGLAVDICDSNYQNLDEKQADTPTQKWLMEHCWEYGFILRYPVNKSDITGIIYEPWHYRYVGAEDAAEIHERDICLEEYLAQ